MLAIILRFWPVFLVLAVLFIWWVNMHRRKNNPEKIDIPAWELRLWRGALLASVLLFVIGILILAFSNKRDTDSRYVPASIEDGRVVPGRMLKEDGKQGQ